MTDEKNFTKPPTTPSCPNAKSINVRSAEKTLFTKCFIFIVSVELCVCLSNPY